MSVDKISMLNDFYRTKGSGGGRIAVTASIVALGAEFQLTARLRVQVYDAFSNDNDPHREHDFGSFELDGPQRACFFMELIAHKIHRPQALAPAGAERPLWQLRFDLPLRRLAVRLHADLVIKPVHALDVPSLDDLLASAKGRVFLVSEVAEPSDNKRSLRTSVDEMSSVECSHARRYDGRHWPIRHAGAWRSRALQSTP